MPVITQADATTVQQWDTDAQLYTETVSGVVVVQRPFTDAEIAWWAASQLETQQDQTAAALKVAAATALANDQTYLAAVAAGTATTAMAVAQVAALTRQVSVLIRLVVAGDALDGGTGS